MEAPLLSAKPKERIRPPSIPELNTGALVMAIQPHGRPGSYGMVDFFVLCARHKYREASQAEVEQLEAHPTYGRLAAALLELRDTFGK